MYINLTQKFKILDKKPAPRSKARGRKNSLALEYSQQKELNKMVDIKVVQEDPAPATLKSILKKPKSNRRRKLFKPRATRKAKNNKNEAEQNNTNEDDNKEIMENKVRFKNKKDLIEKIVKF